MEIKKQLPIYLIACCASCGLTLTATAQQATALRPYVLQAEVSGAGSVNHTSWSVAGNSNGTLPNVMSELQWSRQWGIGAGARLSAYPLKHWRIEAACRRTGTVSGAATDRDYGEDNRTAMTYEGRFSSAKGYLQGGYIGIGYTFLVKKALLTGTLSYSNAQQLNYLLPADAFTPQNLSSTYKSTWKGMAAGIEAEAPIVNRLHIIAALNYRQLKYHAVADWNLIWSFQHPLSFEHNANGYSILPSLEAKYLLNNKMAVFAAWSYEYRETGHGSETLYLQEAADAITRVNAVYYSGYTMNIGLAFRCL